MVQEKTEETIRLPVTAHFQKIDGDMVLVNAEYADVPIKSITDLIANAFGLYNKEDIEK